MVMSRLRQTICGWHGHDNLMQFEKDRMFLECVSCGYQSPGWEVADTPPPVRSREEPRPRATVHRQLVNTRRIA
jgi:hypothetical protein